MLEFHVVERLLEEFLSGVGDLDDVIPIGLHADAAALSKKKSLIYLGFPCWARHNKAKTLCYDHFAKGQAVERTLDQTVRGHFSSVRQSHDW